MESHQQTTTTTHRSSTSRGCSFGCNLRYFTTVPGILKIIELVLSIIAFGCAVGANVRVICLYMGWVSFTGITGFILALVYLLLHIFITINLTCNFIVELVLYAVWTVFFLIAGIVAASLAGRYYDSDCNTQAGAAAAFSFFSMVAFAVDVVFQAMHLRVTLSSSSSSSSAARTTTTTTSTTNYDGNVHY